MAVEELRVELPDGELQRADAFIAAAGILSRSQIKVRNLTLLCNGKPAKLSHKTQNGDRLELSYDDEIVCSYPAEAMELDVLYEDESAIVINKRQGRVVHPGNGNREHTLIQGVLCHCAGMRGAFGENPDSSEPFRPGVVHRLDKETSGVIVFAKNPAAHARLSAQFKNRECQKQYVALIKGRPMPRSGRIDNRLGRDPRRATRYAVSESGKTAVTDYRVLKQWRGYALVELHPATGRTHQLRVHMSHLGHPIVGDELYGIHEPDFRDSRLMLHAWKLRIRIGDEPQTFRADPPEPFRRSIARMAGL